jgi:TPR repeat protein
MTDQNTRSISELQQLANEGDARAQFDLANSYAQGLGVEKSEVNAFKWYAKAVAKGDLESLVLINDCFNNEVVIEKNYKPYFWKNDEEARQNRIDDKYWLSEEFLNLSNQEKVALLAYNWVYKSAQHGCVESQFRLAEYYFNTPTHSLSGTMYWYEMAAANGHAQAKRFLTGIYLHEMTKLMSESNIGNDKDIYEYARKAAVLGSPEAQYAFALMLWNGDYIEQSDKSAFEWFKRSAEQNFAEAQYRLACCYQDGVGVNQNDGLAFEWFKKAAEQGFSKAYSHLGIMYDEGRGVESNHELAFKYFQLAAEETDDGKGTSNFYLARCYEYGIGVEKNYDLVEKHKQRVDPIYMYKDVLSVDPKVPEYKQHLPLKTDCLIHAGDFELLRKNFEEYSKRFEVADDYRHFYFGYLQNAEILQKKNEEIEEKNKQLEEKEKELEDMMSMFAHKFRSPLDAIIYNTQHDNQVELYTEAAQTMRGLLEIFSIISTDTDILKKRIKLDCQGKGNLETVFCKTLDMILLHLLSVSGTEKIQQHYLSYAKAQGQCDTQVSYKTWSEEYFELEQTMQAEWEASYAQLLKQLPTLEQRLAWLEQYFFKLELIGFDKTDIQFKEYGTTESLLTILLNEILVNVFKYYSSESKQPVVLEWVEREGYQVLVCRNPSIRSERTIIKGSHKGHVFLSTLARKTDSLFNKPIPQDNFVLEFGIPNELLISK